MHEGNRLDLSLIVFVIYSALRVQYTCAHDSACKDTKNFWDIQIKKQNYSKLSKIKQRPWPITRFMGNKGVKNFLHSQIF